MDILAAKDQENFVHGLQTQAAGKPLNAGLKPAKTPAIKAPKTPFKLSLNDENAVARGGKSVLQTKGKAPMTAKADGKLDNSAFVTPAGPRTRAPLGMKTTNAKATAFQTPAPLTASAKTQKASPRLRRPKVKVQPDAPVDDEDDVPDIEYMPPKEIPLLDDYDYLPRDWHIPKLEAGGVWEAYHDPIEEDGRTKLQRQFDEKMERDRKKRDEDFEKKFNEQMDKEQADMARHFGVEIPKKAAPKPALKSVRDGKKTTGISTLKARSAAAALSEPRRPIHVASTAASRSRLPTKTLGSQKPSAIPASSRHAAAAAASRSTIGYAQGRENAANKNPARKPLSNVTKPAPFSVATKRPLTASSSHNRNISKPSIAARPRGPFSRCSSTSTNATLVAPPEEESNFRTAEDIERELELMILHNDDEDDEAWMNSFNGSLGGNDVLDEDLDDFQLKLPEDL